MHDWKSLSHVRWDCKYHLVIAPKYRKRKLYGKFKQMVGEVMKDLCRQRGIDVKKFWEVRGVFVRPAPHEADIDFGISLTIEALEDETWKSHAVRSCMANWNR